MMKKLSVEVVSGKDLSTEDLLVINIYRKKEFQSDTPISPSPNNTDWTAQYFLVRQDSHLVAFGRLITVNLLFHDFLYQVLGITTVISIEKHVGYGSILMKKMKDYIVKSKKTAIGFCPRTITPFYSACGYSILEKGSDRFIYLNDEDIPVPGKSSDLIYVHGKDMIIDLLLQYPDEKITAYRKQW